MTAAEVLWLLLLIAAVGAGCFFGGWKAAASYLGAAKAVSDVTSAAVSQSNDYVSALDKTSAEVASLRHEVAAVVGKLGDVDAALLTLFQGFERAGVVRAPRRSPGRQVGESDPEDR